MRKEQFEEFLSAHEKRIYHYLLSLLGNDSDANDVVQMVFISFYEHIDRVEEATALAYVYRIAYNKSMTFLKQKKPLCEPRTTIIRTPSRHQQTPARAGLPASA